MSLIRLDLDLRSSDEAHHSVEVHCFLGTCRIWTNQSSNLQERGRHPGCVVRGQYQRRPLVIPMNQKNEPIVPLRTRALNLLVQHIATGVQILCAAVVPRLRRVTCDMNHAFKDFTHVPSLASSDVKSGEDLALGCVFSIRLLLTFPHIFTKLARI